MPSERSLLREVFAQTDDPVAALRAVMERFGLTLDEAKDVWRQATGHTISLTAQQEELAAAALRIICPKCFSPEAITRKIHTLPPGLAYNAPRAATQPGERFINGFWCAACEVGFVPDQLLEEFGLEKVRII